DVGAAAQFRQIGRARMGDGDGAVGGQKQVGHRLADNVGATDDDGVEAGQVAATGPLDHDHRTRWGAGHEGAVDLAGAKATDIDEGEAVNVLFRRYRLDDDAGID